MNTTTGTHQSVLVVVSTARGSARRLDPTQNGLRRASFISHPSTNEASGLPAHPAPLLSRERVGMEQRRKHIRKFPVVGSRGTSRRAPHRSSPLLTQQAPKRCVKGYPRVSAKVGLELGGLVGEFWSGCESRDPGKLDQPVHHLSSLRVIPKDFRLVSKFTAGCFCWGSDRNTRRVRRKKENEKKNSSQ